MKKYIYFFDCNNSNSIIPFFLIVDWENVDIENNHLADDDDIADADEVEIFTKSKKKVLKEEEEGVRKEHVNVVFIGHVGKYLIFIRLVSYPNFLYPNFYRNIIKI